MATSARIMASPIADQRADADRRLVSRAMRIGLWVWPSFALLDAFMCLVAYPGAPLLLFIGYRVAVELLFFTVSVHRLPGGRGAAVLHGLPREPASRR